VSKKRSRKNTRDQPWRSSASSRGKGQMTASVCVFVAFALLASTQLATAQGTSGGSGAAASIPGSVVRDHEQGPGLFSILTSTTPPNQTPGLVKGTARPGEGQPRPASK
jgi:hypothetical protein